MEQKVLWFVAIAKPSEPNDTNMRVHRIGIIVQNRVWSMIQYTDVRAESSLASSGRDLGGTLVSPHFVMDDSSRGAVQDYS